MKALRNFVFAITLLIPVAAFSQEKHPATQPETQSVQNRQWEQVSQEWYSVSIDGSKSGWSQQTVESNGEYYRTSIEQNMTLSRGGINITIKVTSDFIETHDGIPISVKTAQSAMGQVSETSWVFKRNEIMMVSQAGGSPVTKVVPVPEQSWLTPQAVKRLFMKKVAADQSIITYVTMSPELGPKPVTVLMTKIGEEEMDLFGKPTVVTKWESANDVIAVTSTEYYTENGVNVGSEINAGFGIIETVICSQYEAISPINEIPELMVSLFVEPNKPISNDPKIRQLTLIVSSKDGSDIDLPSIGAQRTTKNEDGTVTLEVNLDDSIKATDKEILDPKYLAATAICNGSDEAVIAIADEAIKSLPEDASQLDKAFALRKKVYEFIDNKGFSTAFASASQTARDRKGDCSEHGVLLCGVLRSQGIPSRGVMGMVYMPDFGAPNGVFAWHMWSQALIDGKWIDLDATLRTQHSVGHVATMTTSLSDDGIAAEMSGMITTIGNLDVEVVEVGLPVTK